MPTDTPGMPTDAQRAISRLPMPGAAVDAAGRVLAGNAALAALAHVPLEGLLGHALSGLADPADRQTVNDLLRDPAAGEVVVRGRAPDTWLRLSWSDLDEPQNGNGESGGYRLATAIEATAEVRANRSLTALSENALDVVALVDAQRRIVWVSPSVRKVLGRDPEVLRGDDLASLVAPEDQMGLSDALAGAEPGQVPTTRTVRFRSATGAFRYMSVTARHTEDPGSAARTAVAMRDVSEELRAKRELARKEEQFRMAMLGAPEGMAVTDSQDRIVQVNPALCELLGIATPALIGHRFREYIPEEDREAVDQWRERLLRGTSIERFQHRLVGPSSEVWVDHSVGMMRDDLGNPQLFVHQFADRTAARRLQADLEYRATHDLQTGLANRDSLSKRLGQRLGAAPESQDVVGVLFCDIDNLKPVNDRYGHEIGDVVISAVATRLERAVRRQDIVARIGGDEFVVVLDHCRSVEELAIVARNLHAAGSHPVETSVGTLDVTLSVGAVMAESTADTDEALRRADAALYRAKGAGKDRVSVEGLPD
jgi:diguanylate cyclase (GGDEF)-like protein/PAS domain S-box-containing protein